MTRRRRSPTLQGRVSALGLAVIAGWLAVLAVGFDVVLSIRLDRQVDDALRVRAQAASVTIELSNGRIVDVRESPTDEALDTSIWIYAGGHALARPTVSASAQRVADDLSGAGAGFVTRGGRRFLVHPILSGPQRVGTIVAALDLAPYDRTRTTIVLGSAVVTVLLLAGAYPVLRFAAGRALRPVAAMTTQAAEWSHTNTDERFGDGQRYRELDALARSLDEVLDRLSALLRHERHLSAELSHELRTPLARVSAHLELIHDEVDERLRPDLDLLAANCAAMDGIIDTLLATARTDLRANVGSCVLDDVISQFVELGGRGGPAVVAAPSGLVVGVDPDIVARILAPIIDNARRYAASRIDITAVRDSAGVHVHISNDGPVLQSDVAAHVFEPGFRSGDVGHDGAGLGLALALRLAQAADGTVHAGARDGRTAFTVTLPSG